MSDIIERLQAAAVAAIAIETVAYASSAVRCPDCRQFRVALLIFEDGALRCDGCPSHERRRQRARARREAAA